MQERCRREPGAEAVPRIPHTRRPCARGQQGAEAPSILFLDKAPRDFPEIEGRRQAAAAVLRRSAQRPPVSGRRDAREMLRASRTAGIQAYAHARIFHAHAAVSNRRY